MSAKSTVESLVERLNMDCVIEKVEQLIVSRGFSWILSIIHLQVFLFAGVFISFKLIFQIHLADTALYFGHFKVPLWLLSSMAGLQVP